MIKIALVTLLLICCLGAPRARTAEANVTTLDEGSMEGVIPGAPPGSCVLDPNQRTVQADAQRPCDTTFTEIGVSTSPGVNLYVRYNQPVEMHAGRVIADYKAESSDPFKLIVLEPPHPGGTFYVALTNCDPTEARYSLRFSVFVVDYFGPVIKSVSAKGKKLLVAGCEFDQNSVILLDGQELQTQAVEQQDMPTLLNRKAAKKTVRKDSVLVEVRDSAGRVSPPFTFVHPDR